MFTRLFIAAAVLTATPTLAQDALDWSGFYAGVLAGRADGTIHVVSTNSERSHAPGPIGGVVLGYDHQAGPFVFGASVDISLLDLGFTDNTPFVTSRGSLETLSTITATVGVPVNRFMPYVSAGVAVGGGRLTINGSGIADDLRAAHVGPILAAGVEFRVTDDLSLSAEYLWAVLGEGSYPITANANPTRIRHDVSAWRAGAKWRF